MTNITEFPAESYLRIFHAPRRLAPEEVAKVRDAMRSFLNAWQSHEQGVSGAFDVLYERFLVVAADESRVALSGCSKDSLVMRVRELGRELGIDFVHGPPLCYRDGDEIKAVDRAAFGELVAQGKVTGDTVVFDQTILSVGPYREGRWEVPARDCWHGQAYGFA